MNKSSTTYCIKLEIVEVAVFAAAAIVVDEEAVVSSSAESGGKYIKYLACMVVVATVVIFPRCGFVLVGTITSHNWIGMVDIFLSRWILVALLQQLSGRPVVLSVSVHPTPPP
jgi:hypothetical protein